MRAYDPVLGLKLLQLFYPDADDQWVLRVTEKVSFPSAGRVRRHLSFDVDLGNLPTLVQSMELRALMHARPREAAVALPDQKEASENAPQSMLVLPLTLLKRETLEGFDLQDATGASLPLCTRRQHEFMARSMLAAALVRDEGLRSWPELEAFDDFIKAVVNSPTPQFATSTDRDKWVRRTARTHAGASLRPDGASVRLAGDLSEHFVATVLVPTDGPERRKIRVSLDTSEAGTPTDRVGARRDRWNQSRKGRDWDIGFPITASAGAGSSYHFELEVPDGVDVAAWRLRGSDGTETDLTSPATRRARLLHHALTDPTTPGSMDVAFQAPATYRIAAYLMGLGLPAAVAANASSLAGEGQGLVGSGEHSQRNLAEVVETLKQGDASSMLLTLLAVAAGAAVFLLYGDRHQVARRSVRLFRLAALFPIPPTLVLAATAPLSDNWLGQLAWMQALATTEGLVLAAGVCASPALSLLAREALVGVLPRVRNFCTRSLPRW